MFLFRSTAIALICVWDSPAPLSCLAQTKPPVASSLQMKELSLTRAGHIKATRSRVKVFCA